MMVCVCDPLVVVKIAGRANCTVSVDFKHVVEELRRRGCGQFVFDLSECATMDSTFLGVMAGLGQRPATEPADKPSACIQLLNPNARVAELLENLGIAHLFQIANDPNFIARNLEPVPLTPGGADRAEVCRTSLEAHQLLMALNPENVAKFKDVTQFLAEDLKRMGEKS